MEADQVALALGLLGAAVAIILAARRSRVDPTPAVVLLVVVAVLGAPDLPLHRVALGLGPINVTPMDVVAVLMVAATLPFLRPRGLEGLVLLMAALVALRWARGVVEFGLQTGTNGARGGLFMVAGWSAGLLLGPDAVHGRLRRLWLVLGAGLAMVGAARLSLSPATALLDEGARILTSGPALVVAQASTLALTDTDPRWRRAAPLLLMVVLLSRQRTVWIATAVMLLVLLLRP